MSEQMKYVAFISYNSADTRWGWRLQKKLERYKLPADICSHKHLKRTPLRPVFFAPSDIQPGGLSDELKSRLAASKNLIVICSPNSAQSEWVGKEIRYFAEELGRRDNIYLFIIKGTPNSGIAETECYNPVLESLGLNDVLGVNINESNYRLPWLNRERAYIQLISKLLGVEFDSLWNRHKRQLVRNFAGSLLLAGITIGTTCYIWENSRSVDVVLSLQEKSESNFSLPPLKNAACAVFLENETKHDTILNLSSSATIKNVPNRFVGKDVRVTIAAEYYLPVDTTIVLNKRIAIPVRRDPSVFGDIKCRLISESDEKVLAGARLLVDGFPVETDDNGFFRLTIPLPHQKTKYKISSETVVLLDTLIQMPCGEHNAVIAK